MIWLAEHVAAFLFLVWIAGWIWTAFIDAQRDARHENDAQALRAAQEWVRSLSSEQDLAWGRFARERGISDLVALWREAMAQEHKARRRHDPAIEGPLECPRGPTG